MRYYLDTNILVFILLKSEDDISSKVSDLLEDYVNVFYVSSIVIMELLLLFRIGKLTNKRYKSEDDLVNEIKMLGIEIVYFNEYHLSKYQKLTIVDEHKDMNDHAIIAQAIADKISLISSDSKFKLYALQGLNFIFNKR